MWISKAFSEYFCCLDTHATFEVAANGRSSEGFFRFGSEAICYGPLSTGYVASEPNAELYDAATHVRIENGTCILPFNPNLIVQNLRRERYDGEDAPQSAVGRNTIVRKAYYGLRPLLPVAARKHLQRISLKGWDQKPFPIWPVDRSVESLFEAMMSLLIKAQGGKKIPFIWFWPEGKPGCAIMTHDVETKSGLDFCPSLMDLNDSFGIKSSFQIIPEGRYRTSCQQLASMRDRGFEVNVHDWNHDGRLYSSREVFLSRVAKINQAGEQLQAKGFRSGILYRNTEWYDALRFSYDMSVPNVGHLDPQPGGCCTVTPFFIGDLLEIPLTTTQDYSLFHILEDFSIDLWKQQIALILEKHGLASFIIHPDYIIEKRARATYAQLLAFLAKLGAERNLWLCLPREVNCWWRDRTRMKLVERGEHFEIEGPGKERARVAFANLDGDRLVYSLS